MEEKLTILKMVEEGKITVEEASKLLQAIENKKEELSLVTTNEGRTAKWIKIKVFGSDDNTKVNVNLPIALVDIAFKIAKSSDKNFDVNLGNLNVDINDVIKMIQEGAEGKIVDIESENGDKVEIVVE
ncbi:hypothetical protein [Sedimentibacter sp. zth1]|uniref:SHOCT-like domain-containing protein n=1 Tax=Sedimentibacter sp. zth1 TaxID=2816908 RepID=UPI001F5EBFFE|nr:hypothetical protein [Sedimentibacter sp. zth1]